MNKTHPMDKRQPLRKMIPYLLFLALGLTGIQISFAEPHISATLLAEPIAIVPGKPFWVGLQLKMEPNWHVYWKNPGDAGLPVSLEWNLQEGLTAGSLQWPYPKRILVPPLMNFGYESEVLLPVEISTRSSLPLGGKVNLKAKAKWIICNEICLPGSAELTLTVPVVAAQPGPADTATQTEPATAKLFRTSRLALPRTINTWKFSALSVDSVIVLIASSTGSNTLSSLEFFPEISSVIKNAAQQNFYPVQNGYALEIIRLPPNADDPPPKKTVDSLQGVLVSQTGWGLPEGGNAVQIHIPIQIAQKRPKPLAASSQPTEASDNKQARIGPSQPSEQPYQADSGHTGSGLKRLPLMLGLAFLGGLILNLMPCVLPVLSLKIFDFVKRAGQSRWKIFSHGLTFTAGVLVSFWILAGLLLVLRSGGQELGWGFQLQSPSFLIVLCALFFFLSLNLFGVFELGVLFTRIDNTQNQSGHYGSFFAGVTATLVATPCTAPFMGSAMGYAFTQPAYYAMLVFTFLGLGMAAPYLLLSGFPGLMHFLPKPGEWMEHLKQFMGFPLLATAIWLAWVLGHEAGVDALIALLAILLLAGMSAWILGKWMALHRTIPVRIVAGILALVIFLPAFILLLVYLDQVRGMDSKTNKPSLPFPGTTMEGIQWKPLTEAELASSLSAGKPVFIDFTADWCLSCKVNERVAFSSQEVIEKFRQLGMVMLKADWTSRNDTISKALAKYGRNSIPLYVLYTGHGPSEYVLLPEILSPRILLQSLEKIIPLPKASPADSMRIL